MFGFECATTESGEGTFLLDNDSNLRILGIMPSKKI
jgi:hypothetical protein